MPHDSPLFQQSPPQRFFIVRNLAQKCGDFAAAVFRRLFALLHAHCCKLPPLVADGGHLFRGRLKRGVVADTGGLLEEIGVDIAETRAAGADFFLHPHEMAEKQLLVFFISFGGQDFDVFCQRADAFYADEKNGREHLFGVFAYGFADDGG